VRASQEEDKKGSRLLNIYPIKG